jgi:putative endonuclease
LPEPPFVHRSPTSTPLRRPAAEAWLRDEEVAGMRVKDSLGRHGEDLAVSYLEAAGLQVITRNWRCPLGEIDVVALDGDCLVVCEVKTRRSMVAGGPLEAVTPAKVNRLRRLTAIWLAEQDQRFAEVRIDVVGILRPRRGPAVIEHLTAVG